VRRRENREKLVSSLEVGKSGNFYGNFVFAQRALENHREMSYIEAVLTRWGHGKCERSRRIYIKQLKIYGLYDKVESRIREKMLRNVLTGRCLLSQTSDNL
jgi:hypothetical protein